MRLVRNIMLAALLTLAGVGRARAAQVVVGTCRTGSQFATIQAAVQASAPGGTVLVCPGTYPEQVTITIPLTLRGVKSGTSQAVVITASGMTGLSFAQILVQNTIGVTISDIIVDGNGVVCTDTVYGILLQGATATISNSVVRNVMGTDPQACPRWAIAAYNSSDITFKNSLIHDSDEGVSTSYCPASITGNTIQTQRTSISAGLTAGPLTISNNVVNVGVNCTPPDCQGVGINIYQARATVSGNTIDMLPSIKYHGIDILESNNATVKSNKVTGAFMAIYVYNSTASTVTGNTLNNSGYVALTPYDGFPGGNVITNNIVNEAPCGMNLAAANGDTLAPNTYHNTTVTTCLGGLPAPKKTH